MKRKMGRRSREDNYKLQALKKNVHEELKKLDEKDIEEDKKD